MDNQKDWNKITRKMMTLFGRVGWNEEAPWSIWAEANAY